MTKANSRGMTIVEMVAAMAAFAVLVALLAVLYERTTRVRLEGEINQEVESLAHFLQDALNNPAICRNALRNGTVLGGTPVVWATPDPVIETPVGHIELRVGANPPTMGAFVGQVLVSGKTNLAPRLTINDIILREPDPARNEGSPAASQIIQGPNKWRVVAAKVVLKFTTAVSAMPQGVPDRSLNLTLGLDPAGNIGFCYTADPTSNFNTFCDPTNLAPGHPDCPTPAGGCSKFYLVRGFDVNGNPECACEIICSAPPSGPPGPFTGGPKGKKGGN